MPSFSGPKWSMIYMKCFSIHHMPCFPMLSLSLPMTWLHLSYPVYIIWIFCMPCFSFRTEWSVMMGLLLCTCFFSRNKYATWMKWLHEWNDYLFLLCTCFFPGMNMLHEWNDFPIWHDYLFLLCTCFFSRNQHTTWMIWLPIWHDHTTFHSMPFSKV